MKVSLVCAETPSEADCVSAPSPTINVTGLVVRTFVPANVTGAFQHYVLSGQIVQKTHWKVPVEENQANVNVTVKSFTAAVKVMRVVKNIEGTFSVDHLTADL